MGAPGFAEPRAARANALGGDPNAFLFAHLVADDSRTTRGRCGPIARSRERLRAVRGVQRRVGSEADAVLAPTATAGTGVRCGSAETSGGGTTAAALVDGKTLRFSASEGTFGATFFVVASFRHALPRVRPVRHRRGARVLSDPGNDTTVASTKITTPTTRAARRARRTSVVERASRAAGLAVARRQRRRPPSRTEARAVVHGREPRRRHLRRQAVWARTTSPRWTRRRSGSTKRSNSAQAKGMSRTSRYMKGDIAEFTEAR